ncbi:hypothetical protein SEVIR_1G277700v4 [Setaria viridis]|uniref:Gnk2-homologous domain-containing protein n=1 Tax=Setaria viridis TaxID=4556 RepID=A0A4U6WFU7_SETVI|nr:cysteine-rich receptor-like protein kinase 15 [Setaria viridis]TKW40904.1 hypothetical protein SEVIR_1G277700v2 [Setaria viridis]
MACTKPSGLPSLVLLFLVLAVAAAGPGVALKLEPTGTIEHFPPLLDCAPTTASPSRNDSAFHANVLSLLAALPSAAAAAPTGSAFARSGAAGRDCAFARGACFGFGAPRGGSFPGDCRSCLSAAAEDVANGCGASRRAGAWRTGCFLSYADTNRSTAREDAFRGWFYEDSDDGDGDSPTVALGRQCTANRTAAECARCLNESVQVVPALKVGRQLSMVHRDAVVVVGYACYLRVPLFPPTPLWLQYLFGIAGIIDVVALVLAEVCGVLFCIRKAREFNPA